MESMVFSDCSILHVTGPAIHLPDFSFYVGAPLGIQYALGSVNSDRFPLLSVFSALISCGGFPIGVYPPF